MLELVQGTPDWHAARLGKVTASRVADVVAKTKSGYAASRANYMAELICERLTGRPTEHFQNDAMRWGSETEPQAREDYEFAFDVEVTQVGFVAHPSIQMTGASPDGLVGSDGMVEFKCPNTATHLETLLAETIPAKYVTQTQWQMACTGREWCDYGSFDPRVPVELRRFVKRVHRDDIAIGGLEAEVSLFLEELAEKVSKLRARYGLPEAA